MRQVRACSSPHTRRGYLPRTRVGIHYDRFKDSCTKKQVSRYFDAGARRENSVLYCGPLKMFSYQRLSRDALKKRTDTRDSRLRGKRNKSRKIIVEGENWSSPLDNNAIRTGEDSRYSLCEIFLQPFPHNVFRSMIWNVYMPVDVFL